jgi:hypothetical protein
LVSALGSEFDDFLFAPIGEDKNGIPVSVLSALARLDMDPWQEAAELDRLPGGAAAQTLAALIAALPNRPLADRDLGTTSVRLIALLPRQAGSNNPSREILPGAGAVPDFRAVILGYVIFIALVLIGQWITASSLPPARVDSTDVPGASEVFSPMSPPNAHQ